MQARSRTMDYENDGEYLCRSTCVRDMGLCGQEPLSGNNVDHRRGWVSDLVRRLGRIFAVRAISKNDLDRLY